MVAPASESLNALAVGGLMEHCLVGSEIDEGECVLVEGIARKFGFDRARLEGKRAEIVVLLGELPDEFHAGRGGGWSFLNACNDRHGRQWTGFHRAMEELFCLGIAIGEAKWLLPRDMWAELPGGMPYVAVLTGQGRGA